MFLAPAGKTTMNRRATALFVLLSLIWGLPYVLIRIAVGDISPATLVFGRTAIGALVLVPLAIQRGDLQLAARRWRWVLAFGTVEIAGPFLLLASAERQVTASLAALVVAGVPLIAAALAVLTGGERLSRPGLVGLGIGVLGVAAIAGTGFSASDAVPILELGGVVLGYAIAPVILARRLAGVPPVGVMAVALTWCALLYAPVGASDAVAKSVSLEVLAAVVALGVLCTATAFVLYAALVAETGPVRATLVAYTSPAVAAVLGVLALGETVTGAMVLGFALVITGSVLTSRRPNLNAAKGLEAAASGEHG
jgi:drug/metabolite transporter (DMT)-like permease